MAPAVLQVRIYARHVEVEVLGDDQHARWALIDRFRKDNYGHMRLKRYRPHRRYWHFERTPAQAWLLRWCRDASHGVRVEWVRMEE